MNISILIMKTLLTAIRIVIFIYYTIHNNYLIICILL